MSNSLWPPWTAACQASLSITNSWSLPKPMSIESVMPSNHLILCLPLLLLLSIFPSIRVFSNESALCIRWPKYCSFSFNISPSSEYSGLISFRMDWLDLLAAQGTLKSLLQHHRSKASVLWCSAFFMAQLSHPYTTTGKTIALTFRTFVGKVMGYSALKPVLMFPSASTAPPHPALSSQPWILPHSCTSGNATSAPQSSSLFMDVFLKPYIHLPLTCLSSIKTFCWCSPWPLLMPR